VTRWLFAVAVAAFTLVGTSEIVAQSDSHIGVWKLNLAKSKSTPPPPNPPPQSVVRTYQAFEGDGIKATFVTVSADGKQSTSTYSAHFDGKEYPITGGGNLTAIAMKRVDANTWSTVTKGPKTVITGTNTVSKDGKTMTWSYTGTNAQGQPVSVVQIFEKQ
jgi:hypothetical protein